MKGLRVVYLLPFLLAGCVHKTAPSQKPLAPPIVEAPQSKPVVIEPPAVVPVPTPTADATPVPVKKPVAPVVKRPKPVNKNQQIASSGAAGVSAIGQLSSGDSSDLRDRTANSIALTDHDLKAIPRALNSQEQKTAAQIREFLKQARAALASGDVDGAQTLALKAKVLLGELVK